MEYFPLGETWVEEHSNRQRTPYLFTGKELDEDVQLYYFGARYYDPRTSVWQSPDPILRNYLTGAPVGGVYASKNLSLYSYGWNNPVNFIDPDGNAICGGLCIAGAIWAAAEVGLFIYDLYDAGSTVIDPEATTGEKAMAVGMLAAGAALPGGGYTAADDVFEGVASVARRRTDDAAEVAEQGVRQIDDTLGGKVTWVDENASMSDAAKAYEDAATGARSNPATRSGQAPSINRTLDDGTTRGVRFDGLDGEILIDRKRSVVTTDKTRNAIQRQSAALAENGLTARWEVPTQAQADRAKRLFNELGVDNITVLVVPE